MFFCRQLHVLLLSMVAAAMFIYIYIYSVKFLTMAKQSIASMYNQYNFVDNH